MINILYDKKEANAKKKAGNIAKSLSLRSFKVDVLAIENLYNNSCKIAIIGKSTNGEFLKQCYSNGCAVINVNHNIDDSFIDDLCDGYLNRPDMWYAKLFSEPVIIANYANLKMALGSTINPRAIILNNGLDGQGGNTSLGRGTHIGADVLLNLGCANFKAGNFSLISANFSAHAMRHTTGHISNFAIKKGPFDFLGSVYESAKDITVGNDVWIGEGVTCLSGVELADGCVIGAGSIITKSTKAYGIYAGNPACFIRYRFDNEKIKILRDSEWWNFSYKKIYNIKEEFEQDITKLPNDILKRILS